MIPLTAAEARDLLRARNAEIKQCRRQIAHLGRLQTIECERLDRLEAEAGRIAIMKFEEPNALPEAGRRALSAQDQDPAPSGSGKA